MAQHEVNLQPADSRRLEEGGWPRAGLILGVGIAGLILALIVALIYQAMDGDGLRRLGFAYLTGFAFFLSITLGALFFVVVTHLFRAGWSILVRRVAEVIAANMPVMAVLFLPIVVYVLAWNGAVYPWAQPLHHGGGTEQQHQVEPQGGHVEADSASIHLVADGPAGEASDAGHGDHLTLDSMGLYSESDVLHAVEAKRVYLTHWSFILRWVIYFTLWIGIALWYWRTSTRQDLTGDASLTNRMEALAPISVIVFGLTLTFASFDLLMSLDPTWYSTMFGIYYFAGSAQGIFATMILVLLLLQSRGFLPSVNREHYHDLGKLLFTFVVFWTYVGFSQYMLIWYGAIPAEQPWLIARGMSTHAGHETPWSWVILLLFFGKFVIPFLGLMSRHVKRNTKTLAFWAGWMLVMQYIDLFWVVMPSFDNAHVPVPIIELLCLVGIGGVFVAGAVRIAARHSLVAVGDPRLPESLAFRNI